MIAYRHSDSRPSTHLVLDDSLRPVLGIVLEATRLLALSFRNSPRRAQINTKDFPKQQTIKMTRGFYVTTRADGAEPAEWMLVPVSRATGTPVAQPANADSAPQFPAMYRFGPPPYFSHFSHRARFGPSGYMGFHGHPFMGAMPHGHPFHGEWHHHGRHVPREFHGHHHHERHGPHHHRLGRHGGRGGCRRRRSHSPSGGRGEYGCRERHRCGSRGHGRSRSHSRSRDRSRHDDMAELETRFATGAAIQDGAIVKSGV